MEKNFIFNWAILKSFVNFSGKFQIVGQKRAVSGLYSSFFYIFTYFPNKMAVGGKSIKEPGWCCLVSSIQQCFLQIVRWEHLVVLAENLELS